MATMRDVAAKAGVSAKTVSRVFNNDVHVLPETRALVTQAMHDLNYTPNGLATTFRAGRASVIGVAVPDIVDPFFAAIARSVEEVARTHGMSTLVASLGNNPDDERSALESLLSRQLSGLIVAPVGRDHSWLNRWQAGTPVVFVDREPIGITADTFTENDEIGAYTATGHLIDHGHHRIAYFGDMIHLSTEANRLDGWRRALTERGFSPDPELITVYVSDRARAQAAIDRLLALPDPPTALFSSNALSTMHLIHTRHEREFAYLGFGDFPLADMLDPAVTVIDQDPHRLGRLAADRVVTRLHNPDSPVQQHTVMDVSLIERDSCRLGSTPASDT